MTAVPPTVANRSLAVRHNRGVIEYRTPAEIEQMRPAGQFVAEVLAAVSMQESVAIDPDVDDALRAIGTP